MIDAGQAKRRKLPSWLPQALGYSISAICLAWVLHGYDFHRLATDFRTLDLKWVAIAGIADLVVYIVHGWRWQVLLSPVSRLNFWRTVQSIYIGLFANEVLPLRPGELIRCYLLAHWNGIRLSVGLASAGVERVLDGIFMLVVFLITAALTRAMPGEIVFAAELMGVLLLAAVAVFIFVLRYHHQAHAVLKESKWAATFRHIVEGLRLMGNPHSLVLTALISVLYLALQVVTMWALMRAYALDYSFWVAGGVLTIVRIGTVVPNAPGNVGLINAAVMVALKLFDSNDNDAKGFSMVYLVAQTGPLLLGGAIATALTGLNIGELRDRARARADHQAHPDAVH